MDSYSLPSTLFLPVSGNPIGFNHFAIAEWLLREESDLSQVVFILSNGRHPDPTKADANVSATLRLEILQQSVAEVSDPAVSYLARRAERGDQKLRCNLSTLKVSTLEFETKRAVTTAETIQRLIGDSNDQRVNLYGGSDLILRMANPTIFSDTDLEVLANHCRYWIIDREGDLAEEAVAALQSTRKIKLEYRTFSVDSAPLWLAPFLQLSSTRIRHAAEANDPLGGMVTRSASGMIAAHDLYGSRRPQSPSGDDSLKRGNELASDLERELSNLHLKTLAAGKQLTVTLGKRRTGDLPHRISIVETSSGGILTHALAAINGVSAYFPQSRFAYDQVAKAALIGDKAEKLSAVSEAMVGALAEAMRVEAQTDFALAESGMAGPPDGQRRSLKNGETAIALATPDGTFSTTLRHNPFLTRREHQYLFARDALRWATEQISKI